MCSGKATPGGQGTSCQAPHLEQNLQLPGPAPPKAPASFKGTCLLARFDLRRALLRIVIKRTCAIPGMRRHHLGQTEPRLSSRLRELLSAETYVSSEARFFLCWKCSNRRFSGSHRDESVEPSPARLRLGEEDQRQAVRTRAAGLQVRRPGPAKPLCVPAGCYPLHSPPPTPHPGASVNFYNGNHHYAQ